MIKFMTRKQHKKAHRFHEKQEEIFNGQLPKKLVFIKVNSKKFDMQKEDMGMIERMCSDILKSDSHDEVLIHTAIAVGYANAMKLHGVIDEEETTSLVDMLGTIGEDRIHEVDKMNINIIMRHLRKKVFK